MQFVFSLVKGVFWFSASQFHSLHSCLNLEPWIVKAGIPLFSGPERSYSLAANEVTVVELNPMGPGGLQLREKFLKDTDGIPISRQLQA